MKVMAQMSMVMNLDKCIGCHTCSVTCKQVWTNRDGMEYVWFNNVETRPGLGYPRGYEDQDKWKGGWVRDKKGRLKLRTGGRLTRLAKIFANPELPMIDDYYEPWTYDYDMLTAAPASKNGPVARPKSLLTGENMEIKWSANWDDDLGGSHETAHEDPILKHMSEHVAMEFENTFMFYLPRICEHCLNPACVSACPSGAMYKRSEDGIVLVDQDTCRGWRMCVTACPYKKVYFNHKTGKAEKCTLCYPLLEQGLPTICSETCVGRLRYLGLMLYDADRVLEAAAVEDEHDLLDAQRDVFLDPFDPEVIAAARRDGIADDWIEAAQNSPIYKLISEYKVALPLHPEYRTMPMVWYIPPLSPVVDVIANSGSDGEDVTNLFAAIDQLRIPMEYLAELFSAGDLEPIEDSLGKLAAMRSYMRDVNLGREPNERIANLVGMTGEEMTAMYELLAIAKYEARYVIPKAHVEQARDLENLACSLNVDGGPGMGGPSEGVNGMGPVRKTKKRVRHEHGVRAIVSAGGVTAQPGYAGPSLAFASEPPAVVARFDLDADGVERTPGRAQLGEGRADPASAGLASATGTVSSATAAGGCGDGCCGDGGCGNTSAEETKRLPGGRINLLGFGGDKSAPGLFPPPAGSPA